MELGYEVCTAKTNYFSLLLIRKQVCNGKVHGTLINCISLHST